ncbi:hypothetical protein Hanom_Chr03g00193981 [Helianthus anomalus]
MSTRERNTDDLLLAENFSSVFGQPVQSKIQDIGDTPQNQNLLKNPSTKLCRFTDPEIDRLYTYFPSGTIFRPFDSSTKSDCVSPIWVCFPAIPFQIGYTYPFFNLT